MRTALSAIAVLGFVAFAWSQPIPTSSKNETQKIPTDTKASEPKPLPSAPKVALPPVNANSGQQQAAYPQHHSSEPSAGFWDVWGEKFRNDPIVGFTLVLAISTILLWIDTRGLRKAAQGQAKDTQDALKIAKDAATASKQSADAATATVATMQDIAQRQLRAYLSIEKASMEFPAPGVPKATVVIKNSGQTPAYKVKHWMHQWIAEYPLNVELPMPPDDLVASVDTLGAQGWHSNEITHPKPMASTQELLSLIGTPKGTIYVYGAVEYVDVFGITRCTKYRLMYGGSKRAKTGHLSACPEGNEAT